MGKSLSGETTLIWVNSPEIEKVQLLTNRPGLFPVSSSNSRVEIPLHNVFI